MQKVADILRNLLDHTALIDVCGQKNQLYRLTYLVHVASIRRARRQCIDLSGLSSQTFSFV